MRRGARSVTTRFLGLAVPGAAALLLSGCAGVGNYLHSTVSPFGDPNAPQGYALNMQRARGENVAVQPIRPQAGDVWPGRVRPVPTLSQIQRHMNVPLGQEYQNQYGGQPANNAPTYAVPPGAVPRRTAPERRSGMAPNSGTTKFGSYGHPHTGSSTSPASNQGAMPNAPAAIAAQPTPAPAISAGKGFAVGQTLMSPAGPAGVVTGASNGRYQTVAPINGQGGGILIPNGNGTATLIQPDGEVETVQGQ